jgi:hypothetical protein
MKRDVPKVLVEMRVRVPYGVRQHLLALVDATPMAVTCRPRGWIFPEFVISGEPAALAVLKPKIEDVLSEWASGDAW